MEKKKEKKKSGSSMGEEAGNQVRLGRGRIKSGSLSRITHLVSKPDQ